MGIGYCYGCMERIAAYPCPKCGYTPIHAAPYALQPGTILQGKYLVGRVLGQGGFGITYIGIDLHLQCKVAIKEYYPAGFVARKTDSTQVVWYSSEAAQQARNSGQELVLKEARKISKLSGIEQVVQVFNVFQENGTAYICMDFIEGHTLQHYLKHNGPMSWDQAKEIFLPTILTMDHIHKLGLIHRDLSPDNLMLQPNGSVKILDLGAAKDLNLNSGFSSMQVAKSGFSPLEQYIQSGNSGPWTDVYAMAATMYYTLTGQLPPVAIDRMDHDTIRWDLPQLQALPLPVLQALKHAMAVRSGDRLQTMEAFARELHSSTPPKTKQKKWLIPAIASVAAVAAVAAIAIGIKNQPAPKPAPGGSGTSASSSVEAVPSKDLQKKIDQLISTCTRETCDFPNGARMELYFNDQDKECLRIFINDAGQDEFIFMAEYDSKGDIVELYCMEGDTLMRQMSWTRNADGKITKKLECKGDGSLIEKTEIFYDAKGRETSRTRRDGTDMLLFDAKSTYDVAGNETYSGIYNNGNRLVTYYDADGNATESITTGPDGKQVSRRIYDYDANGNQTFYASYDANDVLTYQVEYRYIDDLEVGSTAHSYYEDEEYVYEYVSIFGPRDTLLGEECTGSFNSESRFVEDMLGTWRVLDFNTFEDSNSLTITHYNWDHNITYSETFDESGNLTDYNETMYDESGNEIGSKFVWYYSDGTYHVTMHDQDFKTIYDETYDANDVLLDRTEYHYDSIGTKLGSTTTEYNADGSYTIMEEDKDYHILVSRSYDSIGTLLSVLENHYDINGQKTGSVLTTYYHDGSYTVIEKDAQSKTISEKVYDAQGKLIKSS